MARIFAALALVLAHTLPVDAADAPKELYAKSVVISWAEERIQRNVGESNFRQVKAAHSLSVYVSTAGRVFNRFTNVTAAGSASNDQVAGDDGARRVPTFSARSMSMAQPFRSGGGRQIDVEFDAAFDKCSAKASFVKPPGTTLSIAMSPITKKWVEFQSITPGEASCSVEKRNVFGGD
jgi:hypothetical protein